MIMNHETKSQCINGMSINKSYVDSLDGEQLTTQMAIDDEKTKDLHPR